VTPAELAEFPLLAALGESERLAVAEELSLEERAAEVSLFRAGDHADGAWFVAAGGVRVRAEGIEAVADFGAGEVLGSLSLVIDGPRETSAETSSRTTLWHLSRSAYRRLVANEPAAACRLLESIVREYAGAAREEVRRAEPGRTAPVDLANASD
jgi:CRP-like cAMP-binding protein